MQEKTTTATPTTTPDRPTDREAAYGMALLHGFESQRKHMYAGISVNPNKRVKQEKAKAANRRRNKVARRQRKINARQR